MLSQGEFLRLLRNRRRARRLVEKIRSRLADETLDHWREEVRNPPSFNGECCFDTFEYVLLCRSANGCADLNIAGLHVQVLFRRVHRTPKGQQIASVERRRRELKYLKEPFHYIHYLAVSFRRRVEEQMLERQRDVIFDQVSFAVVLSIIEVL